MPKAVKHPLSSLVIELKRIRIKQVLCKYNDRSKNAEKLPLVFLGKSPFITYFRVGFNRNVNKLFLMYCKTNRERENDQPIFKSIKLLRTNPLEVPITSGQKPCPEILYVALQTSALH